MCNAIPTPFPDDHVTDIRRAAIDDVLGLLTAHELYRYRPKAFDSFIEYARTELATTPGDFWGAPAHERDRMVERITELGKALEPFAAGWRVARTSARQTGRVLEDDAPMQTGFAWRDEDGETRTITWGDLRRAGEVR